MPQTPIAVIAEHSSNHSGPMAVIDYQRPIVATNHALANIALNLLEPLIRDNGPKLAAIDFASIGGTTQTAPAIQPVLLFVVRREKVRTCRLRLPAPSTG